VDVKNAGAVRASPARKTTPRRPQIVDPLNFLLATRDSGYRSTAFSIAEFIDNALQASARRISITVAQGKDPVLPIEITIMDDGTGMDDSALGRALTFGGSARFNDRHSLGRYGMGLPNGALSRARRVEVYTWQGGNVLWCRLDIDELAVSRKRALAPVEVATTYPFRRTSSTGTVVRLLRCDRLEYKRPSWFARRLQDELGRIYRRFLDRGLKLSVNGHRVTAVDPMFLQASAREYGARPFGDELVYRVPTSHGKGEIQVRFAELPIDRWHSLSSEEKRDRGITNAPSVSILRADREIDRGWFFMGSKRRENYDDWWRCEVCFDPALDELFGITHAKQAIGPSEELLQILVPDLEPIARALNSRVRQRFELVKATAPLGAAERQAGRAEQSLPSLPRRRETVPEGLKDLVRSLDGDSTGGATTPYQIIAAELPTTAAFEVIVRDGGLLLLLNSRHPLYRDLYGPLALSESTRDQEVAKQVALAVLAAARAEVSIWRRAERTQARSFRQTWADVLATFMNA
jgi:hypothetical protein